MPRSSPSGTFWLSGGLPYAALDFAGFRQAIDALGGVQVDVPNAFATLGLLPRHSLSGAIERGYNPTRTGTVLELARAARGSASGLLAAPTR